MPLPRPCGWRSGNGCGKKFQPTGRHQDLCSDCQIKRRYCAKITIILKVRGKK